MKENHSDGPINLGIVGLGMAGSGTVRLAKSHPLVNLVAAADPKNELLQNFRQDFEEAETYVDVEDLCKSPTIDAVYIATPHQFHMKHAVMAADHGKHIIVEKPMALTLAECDAIIEAAARNGVSLIVGRTASFSPSMLLMRDIITSGQLGRLGMIQMMAYTNFLYRPRRPEELDTSKGGGIIFNQVPHQIDAARFLGGGMVRSVRAGAGIWDKRRPTEGAYQAFLDFEDGATASLTYSGYDYFSTDELFFGLAQGNEGRPPEDFGSSRRSINKIASQDEETALRVSAYGYGSATGIGAGTGRGARAYFDETGVTIVSCEGGDIRASADGVVIYDSSGKREVPIPPKFGVPGRGDVLRELYRVVRQGVPAIHDGTWAKATMEVALSVLESAQMRREVTLSHQVPTRDDGLGNKYE